MPIHFKWRTKNYDHCMQCTFDIVVFRTKIPFQASFRAGFQNFFRSVCPRLLEVTVYQIMQIVLEQGCKIFFLFFIHKFARISRDKTCTSTCCRFLCASTLRLYAPPRYWRNNNTNHPCIIINSTQFYFFRYSTTL